ncbi:MAG: type II toxin-antitoxin system PemK/MazF family toxin [Acetobacter sp.]|nr:type II toxin-antitoxin system PemK/MazF family toxin [Acetobacter sp.]
MTLKLKRGDLITTIGKGDFNSKPRPALVIQSEQFSTHNSVTVLPLTSEIIDAPLLRVTVQPSEQNGLKKPSQVMIDKIRTSKSETIGLPVGHLEEDILSTLVDERLAVFLGLRPFS